MIEQGFFKSHFVGRDGFIWWIGQVAPKETWKNNEIGFLKTNQSDIENAAENNGYGQRYRVRIMGYHTANKTELPDDELPFASLMYPVTAGGGNMGASQSSNITEGTFVFGFFLDGEDAQQPVIMGCIGYNEYTKVMEGVPNVGFVPFTGKDPSAGGSRLTTATTQTQTNNNDPGAVSDTNNATTVATKDDNSVTGKAKTNTRKNDAQTKEAAAKAGAIPDANETLPMSGMQLEIQKAIQSIEILKRSINDLGEEQSDKLEDLESQINNYIDKVSEFIASGIKWVYEMIEKQVMDKITKAFQTVYAASLPNEMNVAKKTSNTVLDTIACFFRKLFGQLLNMIKNFVKDAIDRVVNVPVCFVETFVGKILGTLSGVVSDALGGIGDLVSGAVDIAGNGLDIATDVLSLVGDILSFLQCDDEPDLNEINQWSIVSGSGAISATDFTSIFNKAKNFASQPQELGLQALDNFNSIAETDFSDVFTNDCNTDEVACGPPTLEIFGSKDGSGAAGNLIIGTAGEVLGVDMKSFGIGYDNNTRARVKDGCGRGRGAVIRPVYGQIRPGNFGRPNRNSGTPAGTPDNIGYGPFTDQNVYPFSSDTPGSVAKTPFSPRMQAYGSPSYGLGPSFSRINQKTDGSQLSVRGGENQIEFVIEEFTINDGSTNREEHPRIAFAIQDTSISNKFNTNFDYTPDDITSNRVNSSTVDFVESNATQRQRVVPDERYDVRGFVAKTGDALVNELRVDPGGKTVRADGETRRIEIRQREIEVRDEAEEVYVVFDNLHPKNTIQTVLEGGDKTLRLRDGDGDDANAKLEIKGGNAVFAIAETEKSRNEFPNASGTEGTHLNGKIVLRGVGRILLKFEYDDDPSNSGTALGGPSPGEDDDENPIPPPEGNIFLENQKGDKLTFTQKEGDEEGSSSTKDIELTAQTRIRIEEERVNLPGGTEDGDYDDLVITAKIGKFKLKNGKVTYILKPKDDDDDPPPDPTPTSPSGPGIDITVPGPLTPTAPGPGDTVFPSGGGGGGKIPGILSPGPGSNHTFHPNPGTTNLGPGVWVPGPLPPGGGGPHVGPAVFIHDGTFIGELIGQTGSPLSGTNIGGFTPGSGGAGGTGTPPGSFIPGPGTPPGGFIPGPGTRAGGLIPGLGARPDGLATGRGA